MILYAFHCSGGESVGNLSHNLGHLGSQFVMRYWLNRTLQDDTVTQINSFIKLVLLLVSIARKKKEIIVLPTFDYSWLMNVFKFLLVIVTLLFSSPIVSIE